MICQECQQRPATLHFTKIVNGEKTEFHICEHCAREKGELIPGTSGGFSIHNLLSGLMDFDAGNKAKATGMPTQQLQCPECGMTYAQFRKLGRFGCSSCYETFDRQLDPMLKRVHGSTAHAGKLPARAGKQIKARQQVNELRQQMQQRIAEEEFEQAAQLRDQIRELDKQISQEL
ncbi:UvrB/UvrC motif-containing protein [Paenibacillus campi]|uniref:UvrB/UvrC motif-containing protein n=1 Tax=Paenibacillus campi TaxID=3106031 RepID=UPI002AFF8EA5|nr:MULTISPECIES: UvrB/UvrC motif-containing protein [unclassified Paenibacillus]